ncbi:hypothetical protein [Roseofilum sp. Guam]|uniref:hypothetical protein n=1 Tax=Roseofilum sp. Guam TaxID=2821502 RepID=UPI001B2DF91E|nr:hypothetical protein [Roseofilum sp. Guam]MBP0030265.1 hypothetical protein [Roseofilum sp. Guam]
MNNGFGLAIWPDLSSLYYSDLLGEGEETGFLLRIWNSQAELEETRFLLLGGG